jgi:predicted TIM-barrel fold metal-dependent hydrolase
MVGSVDVNTLFGPLPAASVDLSVDDLQALMRKHGVAGCCTMSTIGMLLDHNTGNAATRAACSESDTLMATATVNPIAYFGGEGPAMQFAEDGLKLVRFFPASQGWPFAFAPFRTLVRTLAARDLVVMVHLDGPGTATQLVDSLAGAEARIVLADVDDRQISEAVALMRQNPLLYVETSHLSAAGAVKLLVAAVGADRVLFGSGAPERPLAGALAAVRSAGLSEADMGRVMGANARALLEMA